MSIIRIKILAHRCCRRYLMVYREKQQIRDIIELYDSKYQLQYLKYDELQLKIQQLLATHDADRAMHIMATREDQMIKDLSSCILALSKDISSPKKKGNGRRPSLTGPKTSKKVKRSSSNRPESSSPLPPSVIPHDTSDSLMTNDDNYNLQEDDFENLLLPNSPTTINLPEEKPSPKSPTNAGRPRRKSPKKKAFIKKSPVVPPKSEVVEKKSSPVVVKKSSPAVRKGKTAVTKTKSPVKSPLKNKGKITENYNVAAALPAVASRKSTRPKKTSALNSIIFGGSFKAPKLKKKK